MNSRSGLSIQRGKGVGRPYSAEDKHRVVALARLRREQGVGLGLIAREAGISAMTLHRWLEQDVFAEVEVVADVMQRPSATSSIELVGPRGLTVKGLSIDDLATLLKRLG